MDLGQTVIVSKNDQMILDQFEREKNGLVDTISQFEDDSNSFNHTTKIFETGSTLV